jgi:copper chaperone CopZ
MRMKCRDTSMLLASFVVALLATTKAESAAPVGGDHLVKIVAEKMCCKGCANKISAQLYATKGVKKVEANMKTKVVSVSLSQSSSVKLGQLWHAVEQGEGGPIKLDTSKATYTLIRPKMHTGQAIAVQPTNSPLHIVIDNLHCKGCAKKIASQLYTITGVTKVSVDMKTETLIVQMQSGTTATPWQVIDAVTKAGERPLAVVGLHGKLAIEWTTKRSNNNHQQAQQTTIGGLKR